MVNVTILDFHADWCGPCKTQDPILDEIEDDFENVEVKRIDVDEDQDTANQYQVRSLPTIIVLDEDEDVVERFVGVTQYDDIVDSFPTN